MEKALAILKKTSSDIALKKSSREFGSGAVIMKIGGGKGVMVALLCETDFVASNEDFTNLLKFLVDKAFSEGIEKTRAEVKDAIDPIIQKTGENIGLGEAYEISGEVLDGYVHNHKTAVMVTLQGGNRELPRDI